MLKFSKHDQEQTKASTGGKLTDSEENRWRDEIQRGSRAQMTVSCEYDKDFKFYPFGSKLH